MKAEEFLTEHGMTSEVFTTNGVSYSQWCKWMQQYADLVSRERAKAFAYWMDMNQSETDLVRTCVDFYGELYDEWLKTQQR